MPTRPPRPHKLHMPQGSFSCPCGAIHLLSRFRRDGESSLIPLFVLSQMQPLRWVAFGFRGLRPHAPRAAGDTGPYGLDERMLCVL